VRERTNIRRHEPQQKCNHIHIKLRDKMNGFCLCISWH